MELTDRPVRKSDEFEMRIIARVRDRLSRSAYSQMGRVVATYQHGILVLRGCLPSQYLKQVAQELVNGVEGVNAVINQIEVRVAADRGRPGMRALGSPRDIGPTPSDRARGDTTREG